MKEKTDTTYYRLIEEHDIDEVLNLNLREADKEEIRASTGLTNMKEALFLCLLSSKHTWVVIHNDHIEGVFGLGEVLGYGVPWFLATDKFKEFAFRFAKQSKEVIKTMRGHYEYLLNYVDSRHTESIKWLKWLGFKFPENDLGINLNEVHFIKFILGDYD